MEEDAQSQVVVCRPKQVIDIRSDEGSTTAEYAMVALAACGFGAILISVLASDTVRGIVFGIIKAALSLGG